MLQYQKKFIESPKRPCKGSAFITALRKWENEFRTELLSNLAGDSYKQISA